jgi:hypothetical protein
MLTNPPEERQEKNNVWPRKGAKNTKRAGAGTIQIQLHWLHQAYIPRLGRLAENALPPMEIGGATANLPPTDRLGLATDGNRWGHRQPMALAALRGVSTHGRWWPAVS